jgi:methyl-accepting chemotaxis protein
MRKGLKRIVLAGAACAFVGLGGCASIESVEHAQATADRALDSAGRAQQLASSAQSSADRAQATADKAQQTASAAQSTADRALQGESQTRSDVTALNSQVDNSRPRRGQRD